MWQVKSLVVNSFLYPDQKTDKITELTMQGWEPYAIDGNVHYFKRRVLERRNAATCGAVQSGQSLATTVPQATTN